MKTKLIALLSLFMFTFSSCAVSKVQVGKYNEQDCDTKIYKKGVDFYLFWETVALQQADKNLTIPDYEKVRYRTATDVLMFWGSAGILSPYHVKIKVKDCDEK